MLNPEEVSKSIPPGTFVVTPRGRVGLLARCNRATVLVQFGAAGPFERFRRIRGPASEDDVKAAGLWGVGGNIIENP